MDEKEMIERIVATEQSVKSAHKRLDELHELTQSISEMTSELKHMREDMNRLSNEVEEVKNRPMKRYDLIITTAITALTSGIIGYLLNNFI